MGLVSLVSWVLVLGLASFGVVKFASPPVPEASASVGQGTAQPAQAATGEAATADAGAAEAQAAPGAAPEQAQAQAVGQPTALAGAGGAVTSIPSGVSQVTDKIAAEAWLVIVESIPKSKRTEAERSLARHKKRGLSLEIVDTDAYPRLKAGMWTLASGPYDTEKEAKAAAAIIKPKVRDLMIRRGL
ncbi:MAG: SPOR domain-containing protein [Deltaproteobacteria bacterium]|nr:SPOR domain-containing protein [Deltaproteobacteria bacterium]